MLERVVANLTGDKPLSRQLNGRQFLVAPITIFPAGGGVMAGSKGPLYYPADVCAANVGAWNHVPLTAGHPVAPDGKHLSAADPDVLDQQYLGFLLNDRMEGGRRRVDGWYDVDSVRNYDRRNGTRILDGLQSGRAQEVSTGLFTSDSPAAQNANHNGRAYSHAVTAWQPDHLAHLYGQRGACSVDDGCGVYNDDSADQRRTIWQRLGEFLGVQPVQHIASNATSIVRSANTGRFKVTGSGYGKGEAHEAAQGGAMMLSERDRELGADAARQLAETGHNPASWVADEATWEKAKAAASKTYAEGDDAYWPAVAHIYKNMGGEVKGQTSNDAKGGETPYPWDQCIADALKEYGDKDEAERVCGSIRAKNNTAFDAILARSHSESGNPDASTTNDQGDSPMKLDEKQRGTIVTELTTNCDCWKMEGGADILNGMTDDRLIALAKAHKSSVDNAKRLSDLTANDDSADDEPTSRRSANPAMARPTPAVNKKKVAAGKADEEEDAEDAGADEAMETNAAAPAPRRKTFNEFMADAPEEVQEAVANAMTFTKRQKSALIARLVANVANERTKERLIDRYAKMTINDLQDELATRPAAGGRREQFTDLPDLYTGAAGVLSANRREDAEADAADVDMMTPPTFNFVEESKKITA